MRARLRSQNSNPFLSLLSEYKKRKIRVKLQKWPLWDKRERHRRRRGWHYLLSFSGRDGVCVECAAIDSLLYILGEKEREMKMMAVWRQGNLSSYSAFSQQGDKGVPRRGTH